MQVKKDNIRNTILRVAKEEFFSKGYKNTSMRIIAKKTGVGLSNIYNYFKNKDEIFIEVLSPLLTIIEQMANEYYSEELMSLDYLTSEEYQRVGIKTMVNLVENFRDELKLLLFHSYGSSLENYRDEYISNVTKVGIDHLTKVKDKYPKLNIEIPEFFLRTLNSWSLTIIGEIVTHPKLTHKEIEEFMTNYIAFSTAGWMKIMKV
jgi:AcrR family transcriptional regulator